MHVALLSLYNHYAFGARCLTASLLAAGHEATLIKFKRFIAGPVSREDPCERQAIADSGHMPVYQVGAFHDLACPYPTPVSPAEKEILLDRLEQLQVEVVGFSLTSSHLPLAYELSAAIRQRFPKVLQVWGGIHPTMDPKGSLQYADAVCVGEGEEAFLEYLADPRRTDIRNFHFKDQGGAYIANPLRPLIKNLDTLPLPHYGDHEILIDNDREWALCDLSEVEIVNQLMISSQRGCPFNCSYCLHGTVRDMYSGQKYLRRKSVDFFLSEIEQRLKQFPAVKSLNFWDDIFMIHPEWIAEFCEKFPKRINMPFGSYAHPKTTSRAMLEMLKKAGAAYLALGIQSGSSYITKEIYGRSATNENYVEFGRQAVEAGYDTFIYDLLSRCPFEREDDLLATVHLLARMPKPVKMTVNHLVFFPFTRINQIDRPKADIAPEVYDFYEMLYILAEQPGFDPALLDVLVEDPYLREHPKVVEQWVRQLAKANEEKLKAQGEAQWLKQENVVFRQRLELLEGQMPWGIKRSALHFVGQAQDRLKRTLNRN